MGVRGCGQADETGAHLPEFGHSGRSQLRSEDFLGWPFAKYRPVTCSRSGAEAEVYGGGGAPGGGLHEVPQQGHEHFLNLGGVLGSEGCAHHPGMQRIGGDGCARQSPGQLIAEQEDQCLVPGPWVRESEAHHP